MMSITSSASNLTLNGLPAWRFSIATAISVFIIEILLFSPVLSYGVLYLKFVDEEIFAELEALWPPIFLLVVYKVTNPISKQICEAIEEKNTLQKCLVSVSSLFISFGFLTSAFCENIWLYTILYGSFSGIGMNFLHHQILISTYEDFQSRPRVLEGIRHLSRAVGLFIIPHLIYFLTVLYGIQHAQCIYSVVILNIIPAGLVLTRKRKRLSSGNGMLSKYSTCSGLLDDPNFLEMSTIKHRFFPQNSDNSYTNKLHVLFNPEDDFETEEIYEEARKPKTPTGVEIMPIIAEESEPESEIKTSKTRGNSILLNVQNPNDQHLNLQRKRRLKIPSVKFKWKRNFRKHPVQCKDFFNYHFWTPLKISLKSVYFLPAVFTKTTVTFSTIVFLVNFPLLSLENNIGNRIEYTDLEAVFLLSLVSFAWLFYLISLVWLLDMSKTRLRMVNIIGLIIVGVSFYLTSKYLTSELTTVNSLVFGLGFGMICFTEDIILRESIGISKSSTTDGTLNVMTGIFILICGTVINTFNFTFQKIYLKFSYTCLINIILWTLLPICQFLYDYFKHHERAITLFDHHT